MVAVVRLRRCSRWSRSRAAKGHYIDTPGERGRAVIGLFRVRGGKIVEHWDASQDVPENSANDNTMY
ncbi:nuclear transport factor 2 family protein [Nonomuraea guangzhouensis]|uniref:SnoaL-like domain-containing protein n=1 Tax=Nonomuraea guangzhouensis TaxID=1291555 RepID=A0ABW4G9V6_9ACTN|nr:hypothetical protein [Nonomuraea guangzhouensis]